MLSFRLRTSNRAAVSGGADAGRGGRTAVPIALASSDAAASDDAVTKPANHRRQRRSSPALGTPAIGV